MPSTDTTLDGYYLRVPFTTAPPQTGIFALQPAPIQLAAFGYHGTMGSKFIGHQVSYNPEFILFALN